MKDQSHITVRHEVIDWGETEVTDGRKMEGAAELVHANRTEIPAESILWSSDPSQTT